MKSLVYKNKNEKKERNKNMKISKKLLGLIAIFVFAITFALIANNTSYAQTGRDPNQVCSLRVWHLIAPDGSVVAGNPVTGAMPDPAGTPVVGATWRLFRVNAPGTWDGVSAIQESWLTQVGTDQTTGANGSVHFQTLTPGLYLARNTAVPAIPGGGGTAPDLLIDLPMHIGGAWVCDINAFPKMTTTPTFTKDLLESSFRVVAPVTTPRLVAQWQFRFGIREGLANLENIPGVPGVYIRVTDNLDTRLALITDTVQVTFWNGTTYQVLPQAGNWTLSQAGNTFSIDISQAGRNIIAADGIVGSNVRITFDTVSLVDARTELGSIFNRGTLQYGPNPGVITGRCVPGVDPECPPYDCVFPTDPNCPDPNCIPGTDPLCPVNLRTFGVEVTKVNPTGGRLQGAVFHIYQASDFVSGALVSGAQRVAVITTGANGLGSAYGLPAGNYVLREVTPPAGYVVIQEFQTFTIAANTAAPFVIEMTVTNRSTFDLPLTGGIGAIIFTVGGVTLFAGGIMLMLVARKKKAQQVEAY